MSRSIQVKVIKENNNTVTIYLISTRRQMPVKKEEFDKRVASGLYEIVKEKV